MQQRDSRLNAHGRTARRAARLVLVSFAALLTARCIRDPNDPQTWIRKLHDPREQKEAIQNLVRIGDPVAVPPLLTWYQDPKSGKSAEVLDAIIHFHDTRAIPVLLGSLEYTEQES